MQNVHVARLTAGGSALYMCTDRRNSYTMTYVRTNSYFVPVHSCTGTLDLDLASLYAPVVYLLDLARINFMYVHVYNVVAAPL